MAASRLGVVAVALVAAVAAGCADTLPPVQAVPTEVTDAADGFELTLSIVDGRVAPNEPIDARADLVWTGPEPVRQLWAAAQGPILFWAASTDGRWQLGPASDAACATYAFERGVPDTRPFQKMLGWSNDDPDAAFYRQYADDPQLRLPAGPWRVVAEVDAFLVPCEADGPRLQLRTEADVVVD